MIHDDIDERIKAVEAFVDKAYDSDFRKVMTPGVAGDMSLIIEHLKELRGNK